MLATSFRIFIFGLSSKVMLNYKRCIMPSKGCYMSLRSVRKHEHQESMHPPPPDSEPDRKKEAEPKINHLLVIQTPP